MIFFVLMILVLLAATLLQALIPGVAALGGARWPLLCAVMLYYALNRQGLSSIVAAFSGGLLLDALSSVPLGFSALLFMIMAWGAGNCRKWILPEAWMTAAFFGAAAGLLYSVGLCIWLRRGALVGGGMVADIIRIAGSALTGALATPLVFRVLARLHRALDLDEREGDAHVHA